MTIDWYARCAYDAAQKRAFHAAARSRLRKLAGALGFPRASIDLRSNAGGIAVSGEVTLHHERVYIQVCQPATGADNGILVRRCQGRRDYTGGRNHFAPLRLLDDLPELASHVCRVMADPTAIDPYARLAVRLGAGPRGRGLSRTG